MLIETKAVKGSPETRGEKTQSNRKLEAYKRGILKREAKESGQTRSTMGDIKRSSIWGNYMFDKQTQTRHISLNNKTR
jgi:hypothetical protein